MIPFKSLDSDGEGFRDVFGALPEMKDGGGTRCANVFLTAKDWSHYLSSLIPHLGCLDDNPLHIQMQTSERDLLLLQPTLKNLSFLESEV